MFRRTWALLVLTILMVFLAINVDAKTRGRNIDSDTITADNLAADSVGSSEIATDAVGSSEIATSAVGSAEIATDAVTAEEIAANAVGSSEIAADAVGSSEIAADAVGSSEWNEASTITANGGLYSLHETWLDLIAVDSNTFMTDVDIDTTTLGGLTTTYTSAAGDFLVQPDAPRRLSCLFQGAGSGSTGTVAFYGRNGKGSLVTDTVNFTATNFTSTSTVVTNEAFLFLSSVTVTYTNFAVSDDGSKFFVGISSGIGIAGDLAATGDVYNAQVVATREASPTIDATYDVWTPATAQDGTKDYQLWAIIDKSPGQ